MDTASLMLNGAEKGSALSMLDEMLAALPSSKIEDGVTVSRGIYQRNSVNIQLTVEKSVYPGRSHRPDSSFWEMYCGNKGGREHEVCSAGSGASE